MYRIISFCLLLITHLRRYQSSAEKMREGVEEDDAGESHAFGSVSSVWFLTKRGIRLFPLLCGYEP